MNLLRDPVPASSGTCCPGYARRFDDWAASYDLSPLQAVLYGPVHDAVLRYAREHVRRPGMILDVGCGTGRLSARLASAYDQARVVGIDASTGMIQYAASTTVPRRSRFAAADTQRQPPGSRVQISGRVARPGSQAQPGHIMLITIVVHSKISMP
jgi:trans-aconitate methyltransferase